MVDRNVDRTVHAAVETYRGRKLKDKKLRSSDHLEMSSILKDIEQDKRSDNMFVFELLLKTWKTKKKDEMAPGKES